jgi:hypothetical protein
MLFNTRLLFQRHHVQLKSSGGRVVFRILFWLSEEGANPPSAERAELATKCEGFAEALCSRQSTFVASGGDTAACVADAVGPQRFDCTSVTNVSATHDKCLSDISQSTCPLALPTSCKDVLGYSRRSPPTNGADAAAGRDGGSDSFRCYIAGFYEVCDQDACERKMVDGFGLAPLSPTLKRMPSNTASRRCAIRS